MAASTTSQRDFQWTSYESRSTPAPPLPSLPPWAGSGNTGTRETTMHRPEASEAHASWRRPTSYFGSMKRLPFQPDRTPEADGEKANRDEVEPYPQSYHPAPGQLASSNQQDVDAENYTEDSRVSHSGSDCIQMHEDCERREGFFRPWKKTTGWSGNNDCHGDGSETVNKWRGRALFDPFAKRRPAPVPRPSVMDGGFTDKRKDASAPCVAHPEEEAHPAKASPIGRRDISTQPITAPRRPTTPVPAPVSLMQRAQDILPSSSHDPPVAPSHMLRPLRSRENTGFAIRPEASDDLSSLALRKSTTVLVPLEPVESRWPSTRVSFQPAHTLRQDDPDDDVGKILRSVPAKPPTQLQQLNAAGSSIHTSSPVPAAKNLPKKPGKKGSTLSALAEIQRKREARRSAQAEEKQRVKTELEEHGDDVGYKFRRLIQRYRDALPPYQRPGSATTKGVQAMRSGLDAPRLSVFVRKRPLAKKELKAKGYDILSCLYAGSKAAQFRTELMCHEPKLKVDCSESLENHQFHFDGVFDELQDNTTVYSTSVGPLIHSLVPSVSNGSSSNGPTSLTVFAYGQTGSGKTYTMKSIYRQAASDLFERLSTTGGPITVGVSFYEIYMNHVNDLLSGRARVQLMEDGDGTVQLLGLKEVEITSSDELMALIQTGEESRATSANAVHDDSSRSHALLRVTISSGSTQRQVLSRLSMVDLAGSERACDTQSDSKSTRMEGAEINKSLLALKECIRALDRGATHIPFRQSKLTQLLRDSFLCANSKTVMIATVSPWSESCNHTLNTLRYADRLKEIGGS